MACGLEVGDKLMAQYNDGCFYQAQVVAVSDSPKRRKAPVKVQYLGKGTELEEWLPVSSLKSKRLRSGDSSSSLDSYDYSVLEVGTKLQAKASDGGWYAAEVMIVSDSKKRAKAPVKVHFLGYTEASDEWISGNCIRSKLFAKKGPSPKLSKKSSSTEVVEEAAVAKPDEITELVGTTEGHMVESSEVPAGASEEPKTISNAPDEPAQFEVLLDFGWVLVDDETTAAILKAEAAGETSLQHEARGNLYLIDLKDMEQVNMATGMARPIRKRTGHEDPTIFGKGDPFGSGFDLYGKGKGLDPFGKGKGFDPFGKGPDSFMAFLLGKGKGKGGLFHTESDDDDSESGEDDDDDDDAMTLYEIELEDGWKSFENDLCRRLTAAEENGDKTFEFRARGQHYVIDFASMTQTNKRTKVQRAIRRVVEEDDPEDDNYLDAVPGLRKLHSVLHEPPPPPPEPANEMPSLSEDEIRETIDKLVPDAKDWIAPRSGNTPAMDFLVKSYSSGLPAFPPAVSSHLAEGVRVIVGALRDPKSAGVKPARAQSMAQQFAEAYTNCQAVQARVIDTLQAEVRAVASHSLKAQLRSFAEEQREMALDRTVCHYHPRAAVTGDETPTEQLPHLSNRYRRKLGAEVGLGGPRLEAAKNDRNAQYPLPVPKKHVLKTFWREFRTLDVVQALVADVNQPGTEVQRRINLELVMKWAGQEESVLHRIFYDESSPELYGNFVPSETQRDGKQPVLHDQLAIELFLSHLASDPEEGEADDAQAKPDSAT